MSDPQSCKAGDADQFHMWIGYCISAWARVEERLFEICWKALGSPKEQAAIVYYKTPSLDARITLIDELVQCTLSKCKYKNDYQKHLDLKLWHYIVKLFKSELATRRRIAHHPVGVKQSSMQFDKDEVNFIFTWFSLFISENEMLRGKAIKPETLEINHLIDHLQIVGRIQQSLGDYCFNVLAKRLQSPDEPKSHKSSG